MAKAHSYWEGGTKAGDVRLAGIGSPTSKDRDCIRVRLSTCVGLATESSSAAAVDDGGNAFTSLCRRENKREWDETANQSLK